MDICPILSSPHNLLVIDISARFSASLSRRTFPPSLPVRIRKQPGLGRESTRNRTHPSGTLNRRTVLRGGTPGDFVHITTPLQPSQHIPTYFSILLLEVFEIIRPCRFYTGSNSPTDAQSLPASLSACYSLKAAVNSWWILSHLSDSVLSTLDLASGNIRISSEAQYCSHIHSPPQKIRRKLQFQSLRRS